MINLFMGSSLFGHVVTLVYAAPAPPQRGGALPAITLTRCHPPARAQAVPDVRDTSNLIHSCGSSFLESAIRERVARRDSHMSAGAPKA
jgi:hypothetical protein